MDSLHPYISPTPSQGGWGVSFGGGTNSTAMLLQMLERDLKPLWIVFADTGAELPETHENLEKLSKYLVDRGGFPEISVTKWERTRGHYRGFVPLDELLMKKNTLPPPSLGFRTCSVDYKVRPLEKWRREHNFAGLQTAVGFDAGEYKRIVKRMKCNDPDAGNNSPVWYPLYAWGITREGCKETNTRHGFNPGKSSCYMCPHMKRYEWDHLAKHHPALFDKAVGIHNSAILNGFKGLGGKGLFLNGLPQVLTLSADGTVGREVMSLVEYKARRLECWELYKTKSGGDPWLTWTDFVLAYDEICRDWKPGREQANENNTVNPPEESCHCGL